MATVDWNPPQFTLAVVSILPYPRVITTAWCLSPTAGHAAAVAAAAAAAAVCMKQWQALITPLLSAARMNPCDG